MRTLWLVAAGAILAACGGAPAPDLLIVVSDAFRADALDCAGAEPATPNLCRLAASGVTFERAYAAAPWTLPSSVAMTTGNAPSQYHLTVEDRSIAPELAQRLYRIPGEEPTLGDRLVAAGYRVEAVAENPVVLRAGALRGFTRLGRGRQQTERLAEGLDPRIGFRARDRRYLAMVGALDRLSGPAERPLAFLYWIDDPHAEYRPPREFLAGESAEGLPRELDFYLGLGHRDRPGQNLHKLRDQVDSLTAEERAFLERLYRLEVASVDERVGYLLRAIELSGRAGQTFIVFTSDHGEAFGEHGDWLHGVSLYDELVRVPLVIAGPGLTAGRRVAAPVSHLDLAPTLLDLLGIDRPGDVEGESLRELLRGGERAEPRPLYLSSPDRLDVEAIVLGRYKLIATRGVGLDPEAGAGAGRVELYDLIADPAETRDLAEALPDVRGELEALLESAHRRSEVLRRQRVAAQTGGAVDETLTETERTLRSVGYLD